MNIPKITYSPRATDKHSSSQQTFTCTFPFSDWSICSFVCVLLSFNFDVLWICMLYTAIDYTNIVMAMALFSDQLNMQMVYQLWILQTLRGDATRCDEYIHSTTLMTTINSIDIKKSTATAWIIPIKTVPCTNDWPTPAHLQYDRN